MRYKLDSLKSKLNGLDKLKSFIGSTKDIYNILAEENPAIIIDYNNSTIEMENIKYSITFKKIKRKFKLKSIIDVTNIHQILSQVTADGRNIYDLQRDEYWA